MQKGVDPVNDATYIESPQRITPERIVSGRTFSRDKLRTSPLSARAKSTIYKTALTFNVENMMNLFCNQLNIFIRWSVITQTCILWRWAKTKLWHFDWDLILPLKQLTLVHVFIALLKHLLTVCVAEVMTCQTQWCLSCPGQKMMQFAFISL